MSNYEKYLERLAMRALLKKPAKKEAAPRLGGFVRKPATPETLEEWSRSSWA